MAESNRWAKRRRILFWVVVLILVAVPVPTGQPGLFGDLGNPPLFLFFDWINRFLPENY
ncbi:MAG: hypothetical protein ACRDIU_05210 [Actinomycetota bacterium]